MITRTVFLTTLLAPFTRLWNKPEKSSFHQTVYICAATLEKLKDKFKFEKLRREASAASIPVPTGKKMIYRIRHLETPCRLNSKRS